MAGWNGPVPTTSGDTLVKALQEVAQAIGKATEYVGQLLGEGQISTALESGLRNEGAPPEEARALAAKVRREMLTFIDAANQAAAEAETIADRVNAEYIERVHDLRSLRKTNNGGLKV
jgi:hypothetical protein